MTQSIIVRRSNVGTGVEEKFMAFQCGNAAQRLN